MPLHALYAHPLGATQSFTGTATIANVTVPAGAMLVVFAGITGDGSEVTPSTVTWGGTPLTATQVQFNFNGTLYADCFFLLSVAGGTHDVVATNPDPALDVSFAVANYLVGPSNYRQSWFNQSSAPQSLASMAIGIDPTDFEFYAIWVSGAATDPGVWGGGATEGGQGLALIGVGAGYIATSAGPGGSRVTTTVTKAISPAAAWHIHTTEFLSPGLDTEGVTITGKTTYGTGAISQRFDLAGRGPLPEVQARIWTRKGRRHT